MKSVNIRFRLKLVKNELSPEEKEPEIHIFWDGRFKRRPVLAKLTQNDVVVGAQINTKVTELPQTTCIVFSAFAQRQNSQGISCLMDVGTNHIPVAAILDGIKTGNQTFELPLLMHTVDNYEKGVVEVTVKSIDMAGIQIIERKFIGSGILPYIKEQIQVEQNMKDTIVGTEMMRIPYNFSESGFQLTGGVPLPAISYVMSATPRSNTAFWENAFETVMRRDSLSPGDWERFNKDGKARVMALMCCYVSQYLDYISDTIDRNKFNNQYVKSLVKGCENFGDSLATWSGDCEDLGTGILQVYNSLVQHKFETRYKVLREIQKIAKQYIPLLSLDVVNGAKVQDRDAPKGAHMNVNLVPIHEFRQWMRQTTEGKALDRKFSKLYPRKIDEGLPFMVGEGTGKLEPLGFDDPLMSVKAYIYQLPSLKTFKKPISRRRNEAGAFLLGSLKGFTDFYIRRGIPMGAMVYATMQSDGSLTRGAYYEAMMRDENQVSLIMDPPVPKDTLDVINEAILLRDPPHDLILTNEDVGIERNDELDYIVEQVAQLEREPGQNKFKRVPLYLRPDLITSKLASNIARDFERLTKVWKVSYRLERITDEIWGYEMLVWVQ